ncbi:MAG TPA: class I SAM-dependent methyltransferase [Gammaproteobacteria bacterium]|nr:class I SAM-dependent methyltransferase [Gammaproteobacteria bacterium]
MDRKQHWEDVYRQKADDAVSWFQVHPDVSLELIRAARLAPADPIIDVGGGASRLVDHLLAAGHTDLTVLDISEAALERAGARLGKAALKVNWLVADITAWKPRRLYRLWHDRAVFHFLTEPADRAAYRLALDAALAPGGTAIVASFALDGPERCSGLPVQRYSSASLAAELGTGYKLRQSHSEDHVTPQTRIQRFQYSVFERQRSA